MIQDRPVSRLGAANVGADGAANPLPYAIELWNQGRSAPERIIARAVNVTLARAIFKAAEVEYSGRRLVLRRGAQVLLQAD